MNILTLFFTNKKPIHHFILTHLSLPIYLFIWLLWVLVAAHSIFHCRVRTLQLQQTASFTAVYTLSSCSTQDPSLPCTHSLVAADSIFHCCVRSLVAADSILHCRVHSSCSTQHLSLLCTHSLVAADSIFHCRVHPLWLQHTGSFTVVYSLQLQHTACSTAVYRHFIVVCGLSCSVTRFLTEDQTHVACMARQILNHWTTRKVPHVIFHSLFCF